MNILAIASFALFISVTEAVRRAYLVSTKKMTFKEAKEYCDLKKGWRAVMDGQNLREALEHLKGNNAHTAWIGKRRGKNNSRRHPPIVVRRNGKAVIKKAHHRSDRFRALCQREVRSHHKKHNKKHGHKKHGHKKSRRHHRRHRRSSGKQRYEL